MLQESPETPNEFRDSPRIRLPRLIVDPPVQNVNIPCSSSSSNTCLVGANNQTTTKTDTKTKTNCENSMNVLSEFDSDDSIQQRSTSNYQRFLKWQTRLKRTFGTPFLLLVTVIYGVQGFRSFSSLAINYFLKDKLGLQPAESQALSTIMLFPWGIKPLYGILSDSLPLCGYHRKSYIFLCGILGTFAYIILSIPSIITSSSAFVFVMFLQSLSVATIDVVIDACVVEKSRLDPRNGANDLQSLSWTAMSIGGVLGSFLSGPATKKLGIHGVFFFSSFGPLLILVFSFFMKETKHKQYTKTTRQFFLMTAKQQVNQLKKAIKTSLIWKSALWIFLSGAISPGYSQIFFFFQTEELKFTPEFLGFVSGIGYVFLLVGTIVYNTFFKKISFQKIFFIAQWSLAIVSLFDIILVTRTNLQLKIPDKAFVLGDAIVADVISRLKSMPVLVLCAKLCPQGIEGTLFALLMSISNFSISVSEFWGALICSWLSIKKDAYENLWLAVLIRSCLKIIPIFFLFLIPTSDPQEIIDNLDFDGGRSSSGNCHTGNDDVDPDQEEKESEDSEVCGTIRPNHTARADSPDETKSYV